MTNLIEFGLRNILLWAGAGAVAVPILCHLLGTATRDTGSDKKAGSNSIVPDQLQAIEGVGPQIASVLYSAGLSSFREISNAKPQEIQSALDRAGPKYKLANPATWPEQARLLADGNIEGFLKLAVSLTAGVTVLENIDGIGEAIGERLRLADINTVAKLGNASEDEIQTALVGSAKSYSIRTITAWKAQAEKFAGGDSTALAELAGNLQRASLPAAAKAVLSGPSQVSADGGMLSGPADWMQRNAAPVCTATLGSLLLASAFLFPPPKPIETRYERDCLLSGKTTIPSSALFLWNETRLTKIGSEVVEKYVVDLKQDAADRKVQPHQIVVIGFASEEGSTAYNKNLSERRAQVIADRLIAETNWEAKLFTFAGRGEPAVEHCSSLAAGEREECLAGDRKIEVTVSYGSINQNSALRACGPWKQVAPKEGSPR